MSDVYRSRQGLPDAPVPQIGGIRAPDFDTATLGTAIANLGNAGASLLVDADKAKEKTRINQAKASFIDVIAKAEFEHANDPDFQGSPLRFAEFRRMKEEELLAGEFSEDGREALGAWLKDRGATSEKHVKMAAIARERDFNVAGLTLRGEDYLKRASNAGSRAERALVLSEWNRDIDDMAGSGWISHQAAASQKIRAARAIDTADVTLAIRHNPARAQLDLMNDEAFPSFMPEDRAAFIAAAQDAEADADRAAEAAPVAGALSLLRQGRLDPVTMAEFSGSLSLKAARAFTAAAQAPEAAKADPVRYWQLLEQANADPDAALIEVVAARGDGAISAAQFERIVAAGEGQPQGVATQPFAKALRGQLIARLKPTSLQDADEAARQLDAIPAFDEWLSQNPQADEAKARDAAATIAKDFRMRSVRAERDKLPMPRYATALRPKFDAAALADAGKRLREARVSGALNDDELVAEVDAIRRWQDLMAREGSE